MPNWKATSVTHSSITISVSNSSCRWVTAGICVHECGDIIVAVVLVVAALIQQNWFTWSHLISSQMCHVQSLVRVHIERMLLCRPRWAPSDQHSGQGSATRFVASASVWTGDEKGISGLAGWQARSAAAGTTRSNGPRFPICAAAHNKNRELLEQHQRFAG